MANGLTKRQENTINKIAALRGSARAMVVLLESDLVGYWGSDSRDPQHLAFLVNGLVGMPQLCKNVKVLVTKYTGCTVDRADGAYTVVNKDVSKKQKAAYRDKVAALVKTAYPTIADIDKPIKEDKEPQKPDNQKKFKAAGGALMDEGLNINMLMGMLQEMAIERAAKQEKAAVEEEKVKELAIVKLERNIEEEEAA